MLDMSRFAVAFAGNQESSASYAVFVDAAASVCGRFRRHPGDVAVYVTQGDWERLVLVSPRSGPAFNVVELALNALEINALGRNGLPSSVRATTIDRTGTVVQYSASAGEQRETGATGPTTSGLPVMRTSEGSRYAPKRYRFWAVA